MLPEAITMGQQKYIRVTGQKREVQAEDKTGKAARSPGSAAPMTPGGLEGEDEVMSHDGNNER